MFEYSWHFIVIAMFLIQKTNTQEPECSKYDFLEKLLEKVIRMEISFEVMRKEMQHTQETIGAEMKATKESVSLGLSALVEDRVTIKKELSELKVTGTNQLNEKTKEMKGTFNQQQAIITRMSEDLKKMENNTIQKIIDDARTPSIAFRAKMTSSITVSPVQTLVFPHVNLNNGSGYDSTSGHFTAPVNGMYLFTVQLCVQYSTTVVVHLVVDNVAYNKAYLRDNNDSVCYTVTDLVLLGKGMKVWVTCASGGSSTLILFNDPNRQNLFAGVLL